MWGLLGGTLGQSYAAGPLAHSRVLHAECTPLSFWWKLGRDRRLSSWTMVVGEVVGDAGIIVPHSSPPALAHAIDALLRDENRRDDMSVKARQHILDNFKWERCAREVVQLYRQTIAAQKAA